MNQAPDNNALPPDGRVRDATAENWVDRFAPPRWRPYLRLARADRPIGAWLLLIPCWWGITLGVIDSGWRWVDLWLYPACAIGAFVMRGAGCAWNDIADRDLDAQVARTRSRPIPSGAVTVRQAAVFMVALSLAGLAVLLTLSSAAIWLGVISLGPVCVYPFAKRTSTRCKAIKAHVESVSAGVMAVLMDNRPSRIHDSAMARLAS